MQKIFTYTWNDPTIPTAEIWFETCMKHLGFMSVGIPTGANPGDFILFKDEGICVRILRPITQPEANSLTDLMVKNKWRDASFSASTDTSYIVGYWSSSLTDKEVAEPTEEDMLWVKQVLEEVEMEVLV